MLLRLADWVVQVRTTAEFQIRQRLYPQFADGFVTCLPLLQRLEGSSYVNREMLRQIRDLLWHPDCGAALRAGMSSKSRGVRRLSFEIAWLNPALPIREVLEKGSRDSDVLVRKWAYLQSSGGPPDDWKRLRAQAASDAYSPIRKLAFESLLTGEETPAENLHPFLFDRSPAIRLRCQALAAERLRRPAAEFYREPIAKCSSASVTAVCIAGLVETGDQSDAPAIAAHAHARSARVRAAAIRGLRSLRTDGSLDLMSLLRHEVPSVAREAAASLLNAYRPPVEIWRAATRNPHPNTELGVLKLLQHSSKWTRLCVYLEAIGSASPRVASFAADRVQVWLRTYNRSYAQPTSDEKSALRSLIDVAKAALDRDTASELMFLLENALR